MIRFNTNVGLGDCFATRPTVAALARKHGEIALATAYPEVFADIAGLTFINPGPVPIRCAERNRAAYKWPQGAVTISREIQLGYVLAPGCKDIPTQIAESAGLSTEDDPMPEGELRDVDWHDLFWEEKNANFIPPNISPLAVFRIPTIRTEYRNESRNPEHGLIAESVEAIRGDWIHLNAQCLGESAHHEERQPFCHKSGAEVGVCEARFGELSMPTVLDLISRARCCVTPISFMAWAALAYGVPTLCVWGGYCPPRTIFGPLLDLAPHFKIVAPEVPCACFKPDHECAKEIPVERVREAARSLR